MSKEGSGWQKSNDNHMTTIADNDKWQERAVDDKGRNKEGKGSKAMATAIKVVGWQRGQEQQGNGIGDKGGVRIYDLAT